MKNLISIKKSAILSFCLCIVTALTAQLPANIEKLNSVEGITEYRLKNNGLRVLIFPDASKQTATVNLTFLVGSRHEGYGETGMAHLLEHMVFKGSPKHKDIPAEFKARGANWNGTTWVDRTNYYETFPASDDNLEWALDLESDRMVNSFIAKKDLETEFSVVRNEFESGENDPTGVLMERVLSSAFLWHNYGKSTIGNRADIENVPIQNLQAFYKRFYQPDNAVLTIAGKIDEKKALALVEKYFSPVPKPSRVLEGTWSTEPTQDGERNVILRRVGDVQVTSAGYHVPAGSHPDFPAVQVLTDALTDNPSGRLYKNLVAANKAAGTWSFAFQTKEPGFVYFNVDVRKEQNLDEAKGILLKTLDDISSTPLTDAEVNRAKQQNLKQLEEAYRNTARTGVLLSEYIALGDWRMFFINRDNMEKVTAKNVERVAKAYFKPSNRTVGIFMPEAKPDRAEIPPTPEVSALVEGYKGKAQMAEGEVFDPSFTNIDARTRKGTAGTAKYAFLSKKTRGNTVVANMTLRIGDPQSLQGKRMVSYLAGRMLKKGTSKHTAQQINDELDALKATVNIGGGADKVNITIETVRDNLPKTLALVNEMLKDAIIPETEFKEIIQQELAACEQQLSDPQYLAQNAMQKHMSPYPKADVRYTASPQEEIDELKTAKVADVRQFYKEFYGGTNTTVSIVGDFDEDAAKKLITEGVGSWKSPKPYKRLEGKHIDVAAKNDVVKTPDKANAMFMAGLNIPLKDDDVDYPALVLGNVVLGGGGLSSRLANRIRQKEGISYGVGSFLQADAEDKKGGLYAYAIYAPENVERLEKAFKEEVEKIIKDGITEEELATAKKFVAQNRLVGRSNDNQLSGKLNVYQYLNRDMKWDASYEDKLAKLTVDDVNKALKKNIDATKISMFKAGDFDKVKKP